MTSRIVPGPSSLDTSGTLVVHLKATSSGSLLKVLSVLHSRRATVHHLQYAQRHDQTAVLTVRCSPGPTGMETVRRSVANIVSVLKVSVFPTPEGGHGKRPAGEALPQGSPDETPSRTAGE